MHRETATRQSAQKREDGHDVKTSAQHLLFLLLAILRKRLKLFLLRLLGPAFACSNHCDVFCDVCVCVKGRERGGGNRANPREARLEGTRRSRQQQELGESGESYEDVCAAVALARFGSGRVCGMGRGSLGQVLWECCDHELGIWDAIG
jgi:hypothetical protein